MSSTALRHDRRGQRHVVQRLGGKLLGIRAGEFRAIADWRTFSSAVRSVCDEIPGLVVLCADYRHLQVMNEEIAGALLDDFRQFNDKLHRSALMLPNNAATIRLQMERLLREATNVRRRICTDVAEVKAWLFSCLDVAQRARLAEFLASLDP